MHYKNCGNKQSRSVIRYYPSIYLEGLRKVMKNLNQHNPPPCQELYSGPSNHKAGVLNVQPQQNITLGTIMKNCSSPAHTYLFIIDSKQWKQVIITVLAIQTLLNLQFHTISHHLSRLQHYDKLTLWNCKSARNKSYEDSLTTSPLVVLFCWIGWSKQQLSLLLW